MAKKGTKISNLSPNAFDAQLLLLDMFLGNVALKGRNRLRTKPVATKGLVGTKPISNVPYLPQAGLNHVNQLMGDLEKKTQNFIQGLTPNEYARMYPAISLSVIKILEPDFSFPLPLAQQPSFDSKRAAQFARITGGQSGIFEGGGYYSTNTFGLHSMNMYLDSQDHPFFGKSYIVSFEFVFDSINTYTGAIPGLGNVSYANLFRSSGRVGEAQFGLKLDIGYGSTDKNLVQKYALDSDEMAFTMFLSFLKSSVEIKENLQVVVKAEYQSREEKMFNSTQLFDILGLDLQAAREKYEQRVKLLTLQKSALDRSIDKAESEARAKYKRTLTQLADPSADGSIAQIQKRMVAGSMEMDALSKKNRQLRNKDIVQTSETREAREKNKAKLRKLKKAQGEFAWELYLAVSQKAKAEEKLKGGRDALLEDYGGLLEASNELKETLDKSIKIARGKLNKVRHDQIVESIKELLNNNTAEKVKKSVLLKSSDLKKYYGDINYRPGSYGLKSGQRKKNLENAADVRFWEHSAPPASQVQPKTSNSTPTQAMAEWYSAWGEASSEKGSPYQNEIDNLANALSSQMSIEYILLGDLLRLIFKKLYGNKKAKAKNMGKGKKAGTAGNVLQNIESNLKKSVIILPELIIQNLEKGTPEQKNLYELPISVAHIRYILSRELYGKNKNTFTLFDLMDEVAKLLSVTRKRKEQVLNRENESESFTVKKMTYPMQRGASKGGMPFKILSSSPFSSLKRDSYFYGMVLNIRKSRQTGADGAKSNIPKFIFGGHDRGIIKNFGLVEYDDDDLQKLILEETSGNSNSIIPSMFTVSMKTVMCPVFQLGMIIKIEAPTINSSATESNIFIKGNYHVLKINHEFTINDGFISSIEAAMFSDEYQIVDAAVEKGRNLEARVDQAANNIYENVIKGTKPGTVGDTMLSTNIQSQLIVDFAEDYNK